MKRNNALLTFLGSLLFFATTASVVTVAILLYAAVDEKTDGNRTVVSIVMLGVTLFLSLLATVIDLIRRKITIERPTEKILRATEQIASGDFSVRLHPTHSFRRYDEYDLIMENLNDMAIELGKSEVLKNDFISNVSHEFKTPLAILQSYAALLQNENLSPEKRREYAETLLRASRRMTDLVTNILKMNKLENQKLSYEKETFRADERLAQSIIDADELLERKEIALSVDLEELTIHSVPSFCDIIFGNLLSNAIKFTEPGGCIAVTLKANGADMLLMVSDTGCGIDPAVGEHIFDKFYQGDTSHSGEGNGLGLPLVKKVIDLLGGSISVSSEIGKGSVFTVILKEAIL